MRKITNFAGGAGLAALLLVSASPAWADGKADRARAAVAEARANIEMMNKLTAGGDFPRLQSEARMTMRTAEEDLARMSKDNAIANANRASTLAEQAIGMAQRNQAETAAAQQSAAETAAVAAQQEASQANARADAAQQAALTAQADAAAARNQPPVVVPVPTTTVTTETTRTAAATPRKVVHRVVKKPVKRTAVRATPRVTETTRTTVSTSN